MSKEKEELRAYIKVVQNDLRLLRATLPSGLHMMEYGRHLPEKYAKEIHALAIRGLVSKRDGLKRRLRNL